MLSSKLITALEPIVDQLYEDIYVKFYINYVVKQKATNPDLLKKKVDALLANCVEQNLGAKILINAYSKLEDPTIPSPGVMLCQILELVMGSRAYNAQSVEKNLEMGHDLIKALFYEVVKNTISLYGTSIISQKNGDSVLAHIKTEVNKYFAKIRNAYKAKYDEESDEEVDGGNPDFDDTLTGKGNKYKKKYKEEKARRKELELKCIKIEAELTAMKYNNSGNGGFGNSGFR